MWFFSFTNSWFALIARIGLLGKFVLIGLLILFVASLAIFINRLVILREHNAHLRGAIDMLKEVKTFEDLLALGLSLRGSYAGVLLKRVTLVAKDIMTCADPVARKQEFELMRSTIDQTLAELIAESEEYLPFFSLIGSIAPLIGLLGTVLGLINAFIGISRLQTANITVIAPGVAEALITTFGGLIVAISGLLFFQLLQSRTRMLERHMYMFVDQIEYMVKQVMR